MNSNMLRVLVIDDDIRFTEELTEYFVECGFVSHTAYTGKQGLAILGKTAIDLLILDIKLENQNGLDLLKLVKKKFREMEVIIVSAHGDMDTVIRAMRLGAIDYLRKPFRHIDIRLAVERTHKYLLLQRELKQLVELNSLISTNLEQRIERHFIGASQQIKDLLNMAITAAKYDDTNVLITGESGTGKENIARIIHYASPRKDQIFCAVNSSSISETLLESEFFGHKKGAFTGAISDKKGFFEISNRGTLFLDEIADMPLSLQSKVLRAIEEKSITRVGETHPVTTNFRLVSATNHSLEQLQDENRFRLDLMHRLNTLHLHIPPLRERTEDIEPLLLFFVKDLSQKLNRPTPEIAPSALQALMDYDFPGNMRELRNMTERAIILNVEGTLSAKDFPVNSAMKFQKTNSPRNLNLIDNEIELIREALQAMDYNVSAAASLLGIQRMALARKMQKYSITGSKENSPT